MKKALAAIAIAALFGIGRASAQTYPSKQITMIVPFAAGGATDVLARFLGERMRAILGQPIIVENVTGAGGSIGVTASVRAPADGYTLEMGTSTTNMLLGGLYPLQFDLINDLAPVLLIASEPLMIVGKKDLPANDLKELIAWLKANPDKASIGIPAVGGTGHLAGLSFLNEIGTQGAVHSVPRQRPGAAGSGRGPDRPADRAGVELFRAGQGGRDQALRHHGEESQHGGRAIFRPPPRPGCRASRPRCGMACGRRRTRRRTSSRRLNAAMLEALAHEETRKRFADLGIDAPSREQQTPEALRAFQKSEADKWWPIIKAANIKGQ